jgi:hypothetical protein
MKKTAAQLNREIAEALASSPSVTISVYANEEDDGDNEDNEDDEDDRDHGENYTVSDDGDEFDDVCEIAMPDVQGDIDERRDYYQRQGRRVILNIPKGRDWR